MQRDVILDFILAVFPLWPLPGSKKRRFKNAKAQPQGELYTTMDSCCFLVAYSMSKVMGSLKWTKPKQCTQRADVHSPFVCGLQKHEGKVAI